MSDISKEYYCWVNDRTADSYAGLDGLPNELEEHYWKLTDGVSSKDWFPESVIFDLDPNEGIKIADSIPNTKLLKVVSEKLKNILVEYSDDFEFYPVAIRNARGKLVKKSFFLANLLKSIPAVDRVHSKVTVSHLNPSQFSDVETFSLNPDALAVPLPIFRLAEYPHLHIVSKDLAVAIKKEHGCNGIRFIPVSSYNSLKII